MQRSYLPWAGLALLSAGLVGSQADAGVFQSQPLQQERLAVLGQPVGSQGWKLLVLEQLKPAPKCWEERRDGLIDPALNRFNFSGICSRYLDSNGYSLRVGDDDVSPRYRLRLESQGNTLVLLAMSGSHPTELVVGRGPFPCGTGAALSPSSWSRAGNSSGGCTASAASATSISPTPSPWMG